MKRLLHHLTQWLLLLCLAGTASAQTTSPQLPESSQYQVLFFRELPSPTQLGILEQQGIQLFDYLPHLTYIAYVPTLFDTKKWPELGVLNASPVSPDMKLSAALRSGSPPAWALEKGNLLAVLQFYPNLRQDAVLPQCKSEGIDILASNGYNNFLRVRFPLEKLHATAALPFVQYLEPIPPPGVPDDERGRAMHRSNMVDAAFPGGKHYDGTGVKILVRDDGEVGPHIDFQGRLNNAYADPEMGLHGDGVAGIIAGAGNLNPQNKGMAAGATVFTLNYEPDFLDETMDLFFNQDVLVTNTSYSQTCNGGYTATTAIVDQQLFENATLMHVFSAGNFNGNECSYGAGTQWGNITGGHKQAKNCLTAGNLDANGMIVNSSSRGPAYDGRIKPDISAFGSGQISTSEDNSYNIFGGTSAAAPGVAGVMAQLHQAYRELNNDQTAEAALLKAALLNSASDLGNPGPDFKYGWGRVNAWRALQILEQQHFVKSFVNPGQTKQHNISIPTNVVQAKIMVYWADKAASPLAAKALINDLDAWVKNTAGNQFLPWVLDPTPDPALLDAPAVKGIDTLNNMEQIVLDNPPAGAYTAFVNGKELPFGAHSYYVVWEFLTTDITVTYPAGGESFEPGDTVLIHWDAAEDIGNFNLNWSGNGGSSFSPIGTAGPHQRTLEWIVPATLTGQAIIKVTRGAVSDESDAVFSIAPRPENVKVVKACPDFLQVSWDPVNLSPASANVAYEVLLLGAKYMEPIDTVTGLVADIPTIDGNPGLDHWIAVRALGDNGLKSERTVAILHNSGLLDCTQQNDLSLVAINSPAGDFFSGCSGLIIPVEVAVKNTGLLPQSNVKVAYQMGNNPAVTATIPGALAPGQIVNHVFSTPINASVSGNFTLKAYTMLAADQAAFNNTLEQALTLSIYTGTGESLDYAEDFEGPDFPPSNYVIINEDQFITWDSITVIGATGLETTCLWMNNFDNEPIGATDDILTPLIDLTTATEPQLTFDVAYARHSSDYSDGLRVEVSTDCGATFPVVIYKKTGLALATVPDQTGVFSPQNANQWRKEKISLAAFGGSCIVVKFVNLNGYGNSLYLDNINVQKLSPPVAGFTIGATSACQGEPVTFFNSSTGEEISYFWDFGPGGNPPTANTTGPVEVVFNQAGSQTVTLIAENQAGQSAFSQNILIDPLPVPSFTWSVQGASIVVFENSSEFANSYFWNFGDGMGGFGENISHAYTLFGAYPVTLTASNACGSVNYTATVYFGVSGLSDFEKQVRVSLAPNPSAGWFEVGIESSRSTAISLKLTDMRGVVLQEKELPAGPLLQSIQMDGRELVSGLYFLKVSNETGSKVLKVRIL